MLANALDLSNFGYFQRPAGREFKLPASSPSAPPPAAASQSSTKARHAHACLFLVSMVGFDAYGFVD